MPTLALRFPARRYHATPWGHHVNEGQIEWPPSPWRLLRALLATGYAKLQWPGDGPPAEAQSLIQKLASVPPRYRLPKAVGSHSRHYMPLAKLKNGREDTTLVFDTWAQIDEGTLAVTWDVTLSEQENQLLSSLAERLGYLGRSESWVTASLLRPGEPLPEGDPCFPCNGEAPGRGWEQIPVMAPVPAERYDQWRKASIDSESSGISTVDAGKKRLTKEEKHAMAQRRDLEDSYPSDLRACLQVTTNWLRQRGWSQPPGSERIFYWRQIGALDAGAPSTRPRDVSAPSVTAMLLSIATASGNDHALPSVFRTLPQAELLHRALVSLTERRGAHSDALTGCDRAGNPLRGPHGHAHILSLDLDADGHIDHMLLWAPMGLGGLEQSAVRAVRRTYTKNGAGPLRLAVAGSGSLDGMGRLPNIQGDRLRAILGAHIGPTAAKWRSLTPFVPPRHLKKTGRNSMAGQVTAELASRGLPEPSEVKVIDPHEEWARRQRHFVRRRQHGPLAPVDCGFTLELTFAAQVPGPICIGYGSHFGLGLFSQSIERLS